MISKLHFEYILIGEIENVDAEFPGFYGNFTLLLDITDDFSAQILNYINFSKRYADFFVQEHLTDSDLEQELLREENEYLHLINSENWYIIDPDGNKIKILVPIFDTNNGIIWRINS